VRTCTRGSAAPRAFTLIELLVVIAVVAVLVSTLLPSLAGARRAAKGTVCLSGLRSMGGAVHMYADANRDHFPISSHTAGSLVAPDAWLTTLEEYGVDRQFRRCPLDELRAQKLTSYATNEHFEPLAPGIDYNPVTGQPLPGGRSRPFDRLSQIPRASLTIYIFEPEGAGTADHINTHAFATADDVRAAIAVTRHVGAAHYLFADGHSRAWAWPDFAAHFSPDTSPFDPETAR
jgi:prepilin-type N-terminal cleavage/methylation domain-containing protein/prepilin-type processing-associated H-X9-DG protein